MNGLSSASSKAGRLQRAAHDVLLQKQAGDVLPTNARFVFYEIEHTGLVRKSKPGEGRRLRGFPAGQQDLGDAIFVLRDRGIVPWWWITDETRTLYGFDYADTVAEEVREAAEAARINPWRGLSPLILVESRSLGGVLRPLVERDYRCRIAATNGQVGGFLCTDVAPILRGNNRDVLYLGDHDHQGSQIEENTRHVLEREAARELRWQRLALTQEQVDEHHLEPIWKKDERYRPALEHWAWEAEAIGQKRLTDLVRAELDRLLPEPLADVLERERQQRRALSEFLATWRAS